MRFSFIAALAAATALSGCVMAVPAPTAPPPVTVTPAPTAVHCTSLSGSTPMFCSTARVTG